MTMPEQVKKQSEKVQQLYKDMEEGNQPVDPNAAPPEDPNNPSLPAPGPNEPPVSAQNEELDKLDQRYRTLQGMYNKDTGALRDRVKHLEGLLGNLLPNGQPPAQPAKKEKPKLINDKDVAEFGADTIDMVRRAADEQLSEANEQINELREQIRQMQKLAPAIEQVAHRQAVSAEQKFWTDLSGALPNWKEINSNSGFQSWLLEQDPMTGITRQAYLEDAQQNLDALRVSNIFKQWPGFDGNVPVRNDKRAQLESQIAPGKAKTSAPPAQPTNRQITYAFIKQFYADVTKGVYKGRDDERKKIEADIFAAQSENRITAT